MSTQPVTASLWVARSQLFAMNAGTFERDGDAYLIDPGIFPNEIDAIVHRVRERCLNLRGIVLTHSHWDHILGPQRIPQVPVVAHASAAANIAANLPEMARTIAERTTPAQPQRTAAFTPPAIDIEVGDSLMLPFSNGTLRIVHAPGHCSDQIVVYDELEKTLWAADMLSDSEIPFIDDIKAYRTTLERLMQFDVDVLVPGHGDVARERGEIQARFAQDHEYLVRLERHVSSHIERSHSLEAIHRELDGWPVRHPSTNAKEHARNIDTVYRALS